MAKFIEMKAHVEKSRLPVLLIGDSLAARWPKHVLWPASQDPVARFAIGGDRTQHILWRLKRLDIAKAKPRHVVLFAGANNITSGPTPEAVSAGVQSLIDELKDRVSDASISVMAIPLRGVDFVFKREFIEAANRLTASAARKNGALFVDTNKAIARASNGLNPSYLFDGEVHYSDAGYAFIAGIVDGLLHGCEG